MRASHKNEINIMNNQLEVIKRLKDENERLKDENEKLRLENIEKDKMIKLLEDRVDDLATKCNKLCQDYLNRD
jgi:cell division protein FtsB